MAWAWACSAQPGKPGVLAWGLSPSCWLATLLWSQSCVLLYPSVPPGGASKGLPISECCSPRHGRRQAGAGLCPVVHLTYLLWGATKGRPPPLEPVLLGIGTLCSHINPCGGGICAVAWHRTFVAEGPFFLARPFRRPVAAADCTVFHSISWFLDLAPVLTIIEVCSTLRAGVGGVQFSVSGLTRGSWHPMPAR